ncbi:MAG: hypothetical protein GDA44_09125 [Prochloron sp. SP5CPC1]|nr:hypothetical protein [Candidatus Paraprochloron terpiosi SP5CPC1]
MFGGLAKVQIQQPTDGGLLRILENATPSIGKQFITIEKKCVNSNGSYFWRFWYEGDCGTPFDDILRSTFLIKKLCFLSIFTWGKLPKDKIISSIGSNLPKYTLRQLVAFLDVGRRRNLYIKHGKKSSSSFELHHDFINSEEFERYIRFIPSEKAVAAAKKRARAAKQQ